jgi:predicted CoA-binding protein
MPSTSKKTLVLGASSNPSRYSYLAINKLRQQQHPVIAVGRTTSMVADTPVNSQTNPIQGLDTVTLYLNPTNQKNYYNYILDQHPRRVIFNPGAENPEFETILKEKGIQVVEACTLVLLATGQY